MSQPNTAPPAANEPARVHGLCSDCPFYDHLGGETSDGVKVAPAEAGICRKGSPIHVQVLEAAKVPETMISGIRPGVWPIVRGNDWCGEHPLRAASYVLGVEHMRKVILETERQNAKARRDAEIALRTKGGRS